MPVFQLICKTTKNKREEHSSGTILGYNSSTTIQQFFWIALFCYYSLSCETTPKQKTIVGKQNLFMHSTDIKCNRTRFLTAYPSVSRVPHRDSNLGSRTICEKEFKTNVHNRYIIEKVHA